MWRSSALAVVAFATGCHIVFPIEPLDGGDGAAPKVFSSPGPAATIYGGYPKSFAITLAADEPGTIIYYTTDGTMPDMTSSNSPTPIRGITISASSTVKYFGINGGARSAISSEEFPIAMGAQSEAGYLVTGTTLDGTSPVVIASPGSTLAGKANVQAWVQSVCSACGAQVVYGVDDVDQGCLYDGGPNVYPGVTMNGKAFNVSVPMTPGVHEVRVAHIEQTSCATAMGAMALKNRPTVARIGVIIVR